MVRSAVVSSEVSSGSQVESRTGVVVQKVYFQCNFRCQWYDIGLKSVTDDRLILLVLVQTIFLSLKRKVSNRIPFLSEDGIPMGKRKPRLSSVKVFPRTVLTVLSLLRSSTPKWIERNRGIDNSQVRPLVTTESPVLI